MSYKMPPPKYSMSWFRSPMNVILCDKEVLEMWSRIFRWRGEPIQMNPLSSPEASDKSETELEEFMGRPASRRRNNMLKKWGRCCNPRSTGAHWMLKRTRPGSFPSNLLCTPWFQPRGAAFGFWPSKIRDLIWKILNSLFLWETCYSSHRKCIQCRNQ